MHTPPISGIKPAQMEDDMTRFPPISPDPFASLLRALRDGSLNAVLVNGEWFVPGDVPAPPAAPALPAHGGSF